MATFRIYYFGLVCHAGELPTVKETAYIVKAPGHKQFIHFFKDGAKEKEPLKDVREIVFQFGERPDDAAAATTDLFRRYVPRLRSLMDGRLDITPNDRDFAFANYPRSRVENPLTVASLYRKEAVYIGRGRILRPLGCVARLTELTVVRDDTTMQVYVVGYDDDKKLVTTLSDKDCLLISSLSDDGENISEILYSGGEDQEQDVRPKTADREHSSAAHEGQHARNFGRLLDGHNDFVIVGEANEETCHLEEVACGWVSDFLGALVRAVNKTSTHAECGNTAWP